MPDMVPGWLVEIEDAIQRIRSYTKGLEKSRFLADPVVIGEAARRLPDDVRAEAPEIPWPEIVALRNRIVHGYTTVDHVIVWGIVEQRLDELDTAVRRMLAARGE